MLKSALYLSDLILESRVAVVILNIYMYLYMFCKRETIFICIFQTFTHKQALYLTQIEL